MMSLFHNIIIFNSILMSLFINEYEFIEYKNKFQRIKRYLGGKNRLRFNNSRPVPTREYE